MHSNKGTRSSLQCYEGLDRQETPDSILRPQGDGCNSVSSYHLENKRDMGGWDQAPSIHGMIRRAYAWSLVDLDDYSFEASETPLCCYVDEERGYTWTRSLHIVDMNI